MYGGSAGGEGPSEEEEERRPGVAGWVARQLKSRRVGGAEADETW